MNTKIIGWFSLSFILLLFLWIIITAIVFEIPNRPETIEQLVEQYQANISMHIFNFLFSFVLSIFGILIFYSLYQYCKKEAPVVTFFGVLFLPAYGLLTNVLNSLPITLIPQLIRMYRIPEYKETITMVLSQFMPGSIGVSVAGIQSLPYVFLGIPAVIFGYYLLKGRKILTITGVLLITNGICYLMGLIDIVANGIIIRITRGIGDISLMIVLIFLTIAFLRTGHKETIIDSTVGQV